MKEIYEQVLLSTYDPPLQFHNHPNSNKTALILDPRYDTLMKAVICNFMRILDKYEWNLVIITSQTYQQQVATDFPNALFIPICPTYLYWKTGQPNITIDSYNEIFLSIQFWKQIPFDNILVFQKDCFMYQMFQESVVLSFDFIGANCGCLEDIEYNVGCINGGCSFRKKQAMIRCLQQVDWYRINTNNYEAKLKVYNSIVNLSDKQKIYPYLSTQIKNKNEDVFFTHACHILGIPLPTVQERNLFAVETSTINMIRTGTEDTCFYHGWTKDYQPREIAIMMLHKYSYLTIQPISEKQEQQTK